MKPENKIVDRDFRQQRRDPLRNRSDLRSLLIESHSKIQFDFELPILLTFKISVGHKAPLFASGGSAALD